MFRGCWCWLFSLDGKCKCLVIVVLPEDFAEKPPLSSLSSSLLLLLLLSNPTTPLTPDVVAAELPDPPPRFNMLVVDDGTVPREEVRRLPPTKPLMPVMPSAFSIPSAVISHEEIIREARMYSCPAPTLQSKGRVRGNGRLNVVMETPN